MENISDVYNKLKKICDVCWVGDEHDSIYIYSCDQKYRLFVSSDILYVEKKYRIFKWEYWDSFTHIHIEFYKSDAQFFNKLLELCSKIYDKNDIMFLGGKYEYLFNIWK